MWVHLDLMAVCVNVIYCVIVLFQLISVIAPYNLILLFNLSLKRGICLIEYFNNYHAYLSL